MARFGCGSRTFLHKPRRCARCCTAPSARHAVVCSAVPTQSNHLLRDGFGSGPRAALLLRRSTAQHRRRRPGRWNARGLRKTRRPDAILRDQPCYRPIAENLFTYLRESGAQISFADGDARISLTREAPQNFDVLVIDAFSGDAIPIHLLTTQAMGVYQRQLAPGGILAFHVSTSTWTCRRKLQRSPQPRAWNPVLPTRRHRKLAANIERRGCW